MYPLNTEQARLQIAAGNSVESDSLDAYYFNGSFLIRNGLVFLHPLPDASYRILGTRL